MIRPRSNEPTTATFAEPLTFSANCSSQNATEVHLFEYNSKTKIWVDKHYHDRLHIGDAAGRREGIDLHLVTGLIEKAFDQLFYYNLKHKDFLFVNFPPPKSRNIRIVLKQLFDGEEPLNVVVEFQYEGAKRWEVTVITAMRNQDFRVASGQYIVEFTDTGSELKQNKNGTIISIDTNEFE